VTQPDIEQIQARAEAADSEPWFLSDLDTACEDHKPVIARLDASVITRHEPSHPPTRSSPNAQFFLHARTDIPALLAAIDKLTRDLNDAVDAHIKITAAMRCGGRTPEKALDTMLRIRQKLGRDK
jgi:hypothetical protein